MTRAAPGRVYSCSPKGIWETRAVEYSAVIPTKDRHRAAADRVRDLLNQTIPPRRIVVVDSSSTKLDLSREVS
jgi:hypothetical protein